MVVLLVPGSSRFTEFDAFLEQALRDKLVYGIRDVRIRKRLVVEANLTLSKAIGISTSLEGIEKDIQEIGSGSNIKKNQIFRPQSRATRRLPFL